MLLKREMFQNNNHKMNRTKSKQTSHRKQKKQNQLQILKKVSSYRPQLFALPSGYFSTPSQQQIFAAHGLCKHFSIQNQHGKVQWKGSIDLSQLAAPLSSTIMIGDRVIEVYLADRGKPEVGKQLNKPCEVTFFTSEAVPTDELIVRCRANNTKLIDNNLQDHQFSVLIPHFTRYTFSEPAQKKEKEESLPNRGLEMIGRTVRSRILEEQPSQSEPLTTMTRQQEAIRDNVSYMQDSRSVDLLEGVKDYILKNSQIKQKQILMPKMRVEEDQNILQVYNNNRALFGYPPYKPAPINIPALQNYMFSAQGALVQLKTFQHRQQLSFIQKQNGSNARISNWNQLLFIKESFNDETLASIICDTQIEVSFRRRLALHSILFEPKISFCFSIKNNYEPCRSALLKLDDGKRYQLVKNWLTWVIRKNYSQQITRELPFKGKLMTALALRQPSLAQDYLIVNNRWQTALLLPNIQNSEYYIETSPSELEPQIKMVISNEIGQLRCSDWLIVLGLSCWYFKLRSFDDILKEVINSEILRSTINPSFGLDFKLFELYAAKQRIPLKFQLYSVPNPMMDDLCFEWLLLNRLGLNKIEQKIWISERSESEGRFLFQHFNYKLTEKIVKELGGHRRDQIVGVIESTLNLSKKEKELLLDVVVKQVHKNIEHLQGLLSQSHYVEALKFCLEHRDIPEINKTLVDLVVHPQIVLSINHNDKRTIRVLLEKYPDFSDILLIIAFQEDDRMDTKGLKRMLQILEGKTRFRYGLTQWVRGAIVSKIDSKLRGWISQKSRCLDTLIQDEALMQNVKEYIRDQQLLNLLVSREKESKVN